MSTKIKTRINHNNRSAQKPQIKSANMSTPNNGMKKINFVKDAREAKNILEHNRR